jgi:hypothetical protein
MLTPAHLAAVPTIACLRLLKGHKAELCGFSVDIANSSQNSLPTGKEMRRFYSFNLSNFARKILLRGS